MSFALRFKIMKADFVADLRWGDTGKGCITNHLLKSGEYTHCIKSGGSSNACHTMFVGEQRVVTHLVPAGVFHGVKSIISPNCCLNVRMFFEEVKSLEEGGFDCRGLLRIASNAHIITEEHIAEDQLDEKIGSTRRGNMQAYRAKYGRTGIQAKEIKELKPFLIDFHDEIFRNKNNVLLFEGSQGFYLDPIQAEYPYCTSSHTTVAGALLSGVPHSAVRNVYGIIKSYDTYVHHPSQRTLWEAHPQ